MLFRSKVRVFMALSQRKDEVFYVQKGVIEVYYSTGDSLETANVVLIEGDKFHVLWDWDADGTQDTELFEFSTEHFDSDNYD